MFLSSRHFEFVFENMSCVKAKVAIMKSRNEITLTVTGEVVTKKRLPFCHTRIYSKTKSLFMYNCVKN